MILLGATEILFLLAVNIITATLTGIDFAAANEPSQATKNSQGSSSVPQSTDSSAQKDRKLRISEWKSQLNPIEPATWSCPLLLARFAPENPPKDPTLKEFQRDPGHFFATWEARAKRASANGEEFKVPEQSFFLDWVVVDIAKKRAFLTQKKLVYARAFKPLQDIKSVDQYKSYQSIVEYLSELDKLEVKVGQLRRQGIPYFDLIDFVFFELNEVMGRIIRQYYPKRLAQNFSYFHSDYGPTRLSTLKREFPKIFLLFSAEAIFPNGFNRVRGTGVRVMGNTSVAPHTDRFPLPPDEYTNHDTGHAWAQGKVDQMAARRYRQPFEESMSLFGEFAEQFRQRVDPLYKQNRDLWKAVTEIAFEIVHRRNFSFDPYFFLHQSGVDIWMKEIIWKHNNKWYARPTLTQAQIDLLPQALDWIRENYRQLVENWTYEHLIPLKGEKSEFLITDDGGLGAGQHPRIVMTDIDDHRVEFEGQDGQTLRSHLWEITLLNIEKRPENYLSTQTRIDIATLFGLKRIDYTFAIKRVPGRYKLESIEIRSDASVWLTLLKLGTKDAKEVIPLNRIVMPLPDSNLSLRHLDNYDHFKMELILTVSESDRVFEFFSRPRTFVVKGKLISLSDPVARNPDPSFIPRETQSNQRVVRIQKDDGTIVEFPLRQVTPAALWNLDEVFAEGRN